MKAPDVGPDASSDACPCGNGAGYARCCGRWHDGPLHLQAPTAEAVMRSRYSACVRESRFVRAGGRWFYLDGALS